MITRQHIIEEARSHIGTRWVHQGRSQGKALDCAGLVIVVAKNLGLIDKCFDINGYKKEPDGTMPIHLMSNLVAIDRYQMAPGDVVCMSFDKDPQHVGIVVPYRSSLAMVHASSRSGKVEEIRMVFTQSMRFSGAYQFPGVAEWRN